MEQIGLEEVLFVQKVYIMSTNEDLYAPVDLGWLILLTLCRGRSAKTPFLWVITLISLINVEVRINVEGVQKLPNH